MKNEYDFADGRRGAALKASPGKSRITIRLDDDVLDWFRARAEATEGGNYQTMINQALREHILRQEQPLEDLLRRVVREELRAAERDSEASDGEAESSSLAS